MRRLAVLVVFAAAVAGCSKGPTSEQCSQNLDHLIELEVLHAGGTKGLTEEMKADLVKQKAAITDGTRQSFMEACVKKTPREVVECTLKSQTLDDAGKCDH